MELIDSIITALLISLMLGIPACIVIAAGITNNAYILLGLLLTPFIIGIGGHLLFQVGF